MPQYIYDEAGKIIGYKTSGNADIMFPFSNAGYILSASLMAALCAVETGLSRSAVLSALPKPICFFANYSGTYDQDLNEEYDYLSAYIKPKTNHAYSKLTVSNVVATA